MRVLTLLSAAAILSWATWVALAAGGETPAKAEKPGGAKAAPDIKFTDEDDADTGQGGPAAKAGTNPFGEAEASSGRRDAVPGYVELSTGLKIPGKIYTTRAKRLKVFNVQRQLYEYVPVPAIKRMEAVVEWERLEKEWRFKEAGNPEKIFTGRSYPARQLAWKIVLRNDHEIMGHVLGQPLYVEHNGKAEQFLFSKRTKGAIGQTLDDLSYLKSIVFGPVAYDLAVEELKAKAEAAGKQGGEKPAP